MRKRRREDKQCDIEMFIYAGSCCQCLKQLFVSFKWFFVMVHICNSYLFCPFHHFYNQKKCCLSGLTWYGFSILVSCTTKPSLHGLTKHQNEYKPDPESVLMFSNDTTKSKTESKTKDPIHTFIIFSDLQRSKTKLILYNLLEKSK